MTPQSHSKAYLEALFHPPLSSGTIGSRPVAMHRPASVKASQSAVDNYKPVRSSILAAKDPVNEDNIVATLESTIITTDDDDEDASEGKLDTPSTPNKALSTSSLEDDMDDPSRFLRITTIHQAARRSSDGTASLQAAQSIHAVMATLANEEIDDEERIEQVRSLLAIKLKEVEGAEVPAARLDNTVLALLHRHREDIRPTGATFPMPTSPSPSPFPASPRSRPRPANLRGASNATLVRPWTPSRPVTPTNASRLSNEPFGTMPASPLPPMSSTNGNGSTATGSPRASPSLWHRTVSSNVTSTPTGPSLASTSGSAFRPTASINGSRSSSPALGMFASPSLNVAAIEFKPRSSATPTRSTAPTPSEPWLSDAHDTHQHSARAASTSTPGDDSDDDEFSPFAVQGSSAVPVPSSSSPSVASAIRTRPVSGTSGNSSIMSMTTADSVSGGSYHGSTTSPSLESGDEPRSLRSTGLEDDFDSLTMTPFDVLTSILNGIGSSTGVELWSSEQIEEMLERNGWDVDATLTAIMEGGTAPPPPRSPMPAERTIPTGPAASRSGVFVVSQEVFASQKAGLAGSPGASDPRQAFARVPSTGTPTMSHSASATSTAAQMQQQQQLSRAAGPGRVCRFFLAGECRRADCRFSHDLNRALCRFWLKGQCLNGDDCSFLHDMSLIDSVANRVGPTDSPTPSPAFAPFEPDTPPAEDFPELNLAPTAPKAQRGKAAFVPATSAAAGGATAAVDPNRARWATTLQRKWSSPMEQIQQGGAHISLHNKHGPVRGAPTGPRASQSPATQAASTAKRGAFSARIPLRPPLLLPTLYTGRQAAQAYAAHRESCIALSNQRNKCLARASEAWKTGNGAEARKWSHEGQSINRVLQDESRALSRTILRSRHDDIRARLASNESGQGVVDASMDEKGARGLRGKPMGAELGVCLGVVPMRAPTAPANLAGLSVDERTDVLIDCHLLHASEALDLIEEFLMGLEREQFRGLAYLAVGLGKHTSTETDKRRVALAPAVRTFLQGWGYPHSEADGVLIVDPLTHM